MDWNIKNYQKHYTSNLKLATPIIISQAGQIVVSLADNIMVARYIPADQARAEKITTGNILIDDLFQDQGLNQNQDHPDERPDQGIEECALIGFDKRIDPQDHLFEGVGFGRVIIQAEIFIPPHAVTLGKTIVKRSIKLTL